MMVRFKTDATEIHARWKLMSARLGMPHMPPSGVSGLDLYARDAQGQWRWAAATRPSKQDMQAALLRGIAPGQREYAVYLPLYNGTESLSIGVPAGRSSKSSRRARRSLWCFMVRRSRTALAPRARASRILRSLVGALTGQ